MTCQYKYNIVCIANDDYAQHTGVMLSSLLEHSSCPCQIFLLTNALADCNKRKLEDVVKQYPESTILFIENNNTEWNFPGFSIGGNVKKWNPIMYIKLFLPSLLPSTIDRVLFLDADLIINTDIKDLYEMDLSKCIIAAAEDWKYSYFHKERLKLQPEAYYINSGVMMVNLSQWRKLNQQSPIKQFMINNKDYIINDQDAFALYFQNKIQYISQKWNATTYYFERKPRVYDKYLPIVNDIRKNPYIIHFCEPIKPWYRECRHPYKKLYKKYLKQTPWKNYKFPSCELHFGKPAWRYIVKHWLNLYHLRQDDWAMISLKEQYKHEKK